MKKPILLSLVILSLIAACVVAVLSVRSTVLPHDYDQVRVQLGWKHQAQFAGFYVALEKGLYEDAWLDVSIDDLAEQKDQVQLLLDGKYDVSVMEAHQFLAGADASDELIAIAAVYQTNPHVLATRRDSGIETIDDFAGKRFGLSGGEGEGDILFRIFLESYVGLDDVSFIPLGFDTIEDFKQNRADIIDIYEIDQLFLAEQENIELKTFPLDTYGLATYGDVIVTTRSFAQEHPETLRDFLQATFDGWEYAFAHPSEAVDIVYEWAEGDYKDREYQEFILLESISYIRKSDVKLGEMNFIPWSTLYGSMAGVGILSKDLDLSSLYTNQFLR